MVSAWCPGAFGCGLRGPGKGKAQVTLTFHRRVILEAGRPRGSAKVKMVLGQGRDWPGMRRPTITASSSSFHFRPSFVVTLGLGGCRPPLNWPGWHVVARFTHNGHVSCYASLSTGHLIRREISGT